MGRVCSQTFPLSQDELKKLVGKLTPLTDKDKEARDDIRVPCTRIVNQLNTQVRLTPVLVSCVTAASASASASSKVSGARDG